MVESQPPGDLHNMSLKEAMEYPFTVEHQPSLIFKRTRSTNSTTHEGVALVGRDTNESGDSARSKAFLARYVRGVVACKECMEPRCLYSIEAFNI